LCVALLFGEAVHTFFAITGAGTSPTLRCVARRSIEPKVFVVTYDAVADTEVIIFFPPLKQSLVLARNIALHYQQHH